MLVEARARREGLGPLARETEGLSLNSYVLELRANARVTKALDHGTCRAIFLGCSFACVLRFTGLA